jgi:uncharacterized protein YkwD
MLAAFLLLAACAALQQPGPGAGASNAAAPALAKIRSENGLLPLIPDSRLEQAALRQATYMARAGDLTHTTGWRRDFASRMRKADIHGFREENIAYGRFDTAKVLNVWMNSSPHRKNMLNPKVTRFGLASVDDGKGDGRYYCAMVLDD